MKMLFALALASAGIGLAVGAEAHMAGAVTDDFISGVMHFLSGPDHVAFAFALGLAAGWSLAARRMGISLNAAVAVLAVGSYAAFQQILAHGLDAAFLGGVLIATTSTAACGVGIFKAIFGMNQRWNTPFR